MRNEGKISFKLYGFVALRAKIFPQRREGAKKFFQLHTFGNLNSQQRESTFNDFTNRF